MVSGLVTSPCDQLRIFSGEARLIRMESKSAIKFALSYGEERYIKSPYKNSEARIQKSESRMAVTATILNSEFSNSEFSSLVCRERRILDFSRLFHQLHIQTQRLQLADQDVE